MHLRSIPKLVRFVGGLALVFLGAALMPSGAAAIPLVIGIPLLVSLRLQTFTEANEAWLRRRGTGRKSNAETEE
jgi:hypothetical protein